MSWGDFTHFLQYTAQVNAFLPHTLIPPVAWLATILEMLLGFTLVVGLQKAEFPGGIRADGADQTLRSALCLTARQPVAAGRGRQLAPDFPPPLD